MHIVPASQVHGFRLCPVARGFFASLLLLAGGATLAHADQFYPAWLQEYKSDPALNASQGGKAIAVDKRSNRLRENPS